MNGFESVGSVTVSSSFITTYFGDTTSLTLYPKWNACKYTISFDSNGGTGDVPASLSNITIGYQITIPAVPFAKTGYASNGWNTSSDGTGTSLSRTGAVTFDEAFILTYYPNGYSIVLYPAWSVLSYSISFNSNNGTGDAPSGLAGLRIGSEVDMPPMSLTRIGYSGTGWNTRSDGAGTSISESVWTLTGERIQTIFGDSQAVTLYAEWSINRYTITFSANGGTGDAPASLSNITIGSEIAIPAVPFARTGYASAGWNTSSDGTGASMTRTGTVPFDETFILTYAPNGCSVGFHAVWSPLSYSISFSSNSGTGNAPSGLAGLRIGSEVAIPSMPLTRVGYDGTGWNTESDGTGTNLAESRWELTADRIRSIFGESQAVTLYAEWTVSRYTISFHSNGGIGDVPASLSSITIGSQITIPAVPFSKVGYASNGWNTSSDGTGASLSRTGSVTFDEAFILTYVPNGYSVGFHAVWSPLLYSISYNSNNGAGEVPLNSVGLRIGSEVTMPAMSLIRTGYDGTGWNTRNDGTGISFTGPGWTLTEEMILSVFGESQTVTMYAEWEMSRYSISFGANGGTGNAPASLNNVTIGSEIAIPEVPFARIGYASNGWNTSADGTGTSLLRTGTVLFDETFIMTYCPAGYSIGFHASWSVLSYSVSFNPNEGNGNVPSGLTGMHIGSEAAIPPMSLTRIGYGGTGWNTSADGNGAHYSESVWELTAERIQSLFGESQTVTLYAEWTVSRYTISFDANGGIGNVPASLSDITIGSEITIPEIPFARTGYASNGWSTSGDGTGTSLPRTGTFTFDETFIMTYCPNAYGLVLYASWSVLPYSITFNSNNGIGDVPSGLTGITIGSEVSVPSMSLTRIGYDGAGWNTRNDGTGTNFTEFRWTLTAERILEIFGGSQSVTLFAEWTISRYEISFDDNGGIGNAPARLSGITIGSEITIPAVPFTRIGYASNGWNTSADGTGTQVSRTGTVTFDEAFILTYFQSGYSIGLHALWTPLSYSILFNSNSGIGSVPTNVADLRIGSEVAIPSMPLTRVGYVGTGWNTSADGNGAHYSESGWELTAERIQGLFGDSQAVTLFAEWTVSRYTISFDPNGGTGDVPVSLSDVTIGSEITIPAVPFTRIGYASGGWNTSSDGTGSQAPRAGTVTVDETFILTYFSNGCSVRFHAVWYPLSYSFSFNSNNGRGDIPSDVAGITIGSEVPIPSMPLTRIGYEGTGWNTRNDGMGMSFTESRWELTEERILSIFGGSQSVSLFAEWSVSRYTISFYANGGTGDVPASLSGITIGSEITIPEVPFARIGYASNGWNTSADGTGASAPRAGTAAFDEAFILTYCPVGYGIAFHASWSVLSYSVAFNSNGGSGNVPSDVAGITIGSEVAIPSMPLTRVGYDGAGWNTRNDGTGTGFSESRWTLTEERILSIFGGSQSVTLYAGWSAIGYSVSFDRNGGSGDLPASLSNITIGSDLAIPSVGLSKIGYSVTGWNTSSDGTGTHLEPLRTTLTESAIMTLFGQSRAITLHPEWVMNEYVLNFDANGSAGTVPDAVSVSLASAASIPSAELSRDGYEAVGWNTSPDGRGTSVAAGRFLLNEQSIVSLFPDSMSVTLYPEWTVRYYRVGYEVLGSVRDIITEGANVESSVLLTADIPVSEGHVFRGWTTDAGMSLLIPGSGYVIGGTDIPRQGESVIMHAVFGIDISFSKGLCTDDFRMPDTIRSDAVSAVVSLGTPVNQSPGASAWRFLGYSVNGTDLTYPTDSLSGIQFTESTELTALWSVPVTGTAVNCSVSAGSTAVAGQSWSMDVSVPAGYAISEFSASMGGTDLRADGTSVSAGAVTAPITYEVRAAPVVYTVTLTTGHGTVAGSGWTHILTGGNNSYVTEFTVESDAIQFPDPVPENEFKVFAGWRMSGEDANGVPHGTVGDRVIEALWENRTFKVYTVVNGEKVRMDPTVESTIPEPSAPEGYRFAGWTYIDRDGNTQKMTSMTELFEGMQLVASFEPTEDDPAEMAVAALIVVVMCGAVMMFPIRRR